MNFPTKESLKIIGIVGGIIALVGIVIYALLWAIVTVIGLFGKSITNWEALAILIVISFVLKPKSKLTTSVVR